MTDIGIADAHVHCDDPSFIDPGMDCLTKAGVQKFAVQSRSHMGAPGPWQALGNANPVALAAKALYPDRVYAFGAINHHPALTLLEEDFARDLVAQARRLHVMGCDGVKLLEMKPSHYVTFPYPLGHPVFEGFFSTIEDLGLPVMWHVADPVSFWDPEKTTDQLRELGWFYGDGDYPTYDALYEESLAVVARHPKLTVIFAHFYFLSGDLDRLASLLNEHPNMNVDITPGSEMYRDFAANVERAREFFIARKGRIFYGTDIEFNPDYFDPERAARHIGFIRRFLETGDPFKWPSGEEKHGLGLPEDAIAQICGKNFLRVAGQTPRPLDKAAALAECDRLAALSDDGETPASVVKSREIITAS